MKISVTVTSQPPPHRVGAGCEPSRQHHEVTLEATPQAIIEAVWQAFSSGLFDAGGCVNVVIQRAGDRPASGVSPA